MPIMYIAGKLLDGHKLGYDEGLKNWEKIIDIAHKIAQKGWTLEIPHHSLFMWQYLKNNHDINLPYEFWMQQDSGKIKVCQALFFVSHSKGADLELQYALDNDMKVYYNINEVPTVPVEDCLLRQPIFTKPYVVESTEGNQGNQ